MTQLILKTCFGSLSIASLGKLPKTEQLMFDNLSHARLLFSMDARDVCGAWVKSGVRFSLIVSAFGNCCPAPIIENCIPQGASLTIKPPWSVCTV
jgi:hypothetical protein